jgi:hypothetical protein
MNNDGLQDAVLTNVFGKFVELGFRHFGARVLRVDEQAGQRQHQGPAASAARCCHHHIGQDFEPQQIKLKMVRVFARHTHDVQRAAALQQTIEPVLMPRLEQAIVDHLGQQKAGTPWLRFEDDPVVRSPVVHFAYPTAAAPGFDYLRREVKLELGSLTDQRPTEQHPLPAWVVDDFPAAVVDWTCQVTALELQRTFWEKATILHAEHHRPVDQAMPDRYARHYSGMMR